ncbi:MAG: hypothetical protein EYC70_02450 [Planctomycetota bacterium]|nr:MAG: hypothetical protein EYC70_02450 [Planctomycetota bacterium]
MLPLPALPVLLAGAVLQDPPVPQPTVRIGVTAQAPVLDGVPDEAAWEPAGRITRFIEVEPVEGRPASAPTEVWLMRDADMLYIALVCVEPEPRRLVLLNMARDAFLDEDDRIEFILDTFHDGRSAYFFQISAAGSRGDALIGDNGQRFNKRWDTYWEGKARVGADRWTAEIAIPLRAIAFGAQDAWGANFMRYRGPDRSQARWASPYRSTDLFQVSEAGDLTGMTGLEQGLGLELVPYYKVKDVKTERPEDHDLLGTGGGELNWRITPRLTASVTVNTDFAETEADLRQVNLTRFPLFFPEKRDFFLQDSNLFAFGEQTGFEGEADLLPFFTRRIGLSPEGHEIPIEGGARLSGRAGDLDLGLLGVRTEDLESEGIPAADLYVARPSYNVSEDLALGALLTDGNPYDTADNRVQGVDLRYSSADFLPGSLSWNAWWTRSDDAASGDVGYGYGTEASLQTSDWDFRVNTLASQRAYRPALGFVRRPGERRIGAGVSWEPRPPQPDPLRNFAFGVEPELWTDLSGELQTYAVGITLLGLNWNSGDSAQLDLSFEGDRLERGFSPVSGSFIPAGSYDWVTAGAGFQSSTARKLAVGLDLEAGSFYDGEGVSLGATGEWRPDAHLRLGLQYSENRIRLPRGDFVTRLEILNFDYVFTPDVSLENLVQADNESDLLGVQSRLHWILEDGREAFLVVNAGWQELADSTIVPAGRDITLKLVYSIRF